MYLLDKISTAWTAMNNLGTGSEKDPLKEYYPRGDLEGKVVRVERIGRDTSNDTVAAREQTLTQYRCQDGAFKAAYGSDVRTDGVDDLICPENRNGTPTLCKNPEVTEPQVTFYPYEDTMSPEEGCYYTPEVARASAKHMQEVVCPQIPNAKTGICFSNNPNSNADNSSALAALSVPIVLGGVALIAGVACQVGAIYYRFWGKKEAQVAPTILQSPVADTSAAVALPKSISTANLVDYGSVSEETVV